MGQVKSEFDVAIIGAGIAGSALAAALDGTSLKVVVIEGGPIRFDKPPVEEGVEAYDPRVSALTLASRQFLEELGVWQSIEALRDKPFGNMYVWDGEGTANISFSAKEIGEQSLGSVVENRVIVNALLQSLQMSTNVKLIDQVRVQQISQLKEADGISHMVALDDGREIRAQLIVGADGANSFVRQNFHFKTREWDYGHHGIVCSVETEKSHENTAWQRFMSTGPLAFLPLKAASGDHVSSIVWSAEIETANRYMAMSDEEFMQALANASEHKLGEIKAVSKRYSFPLRQRHAVDYVQQGVALVGDAAHTIHPLAGQGINLGLQDVAVLSDELIRAHKLGHVLSDLRVLSRYQRRRKGENLLMMSAMEGFKRLFEQQSLLVTWIRNRGMSGVDKFGLLKRQIMKQAMGVR